MLPTLGAHREVHHNGIRLWKDNSGKFSVEAKYVRAVGGKVYLQKPDSSVIFVTLSRLSQADQSWVRSASQPATDKPSPKKHFQPFAGNVKTLTDQNDLLVESNGMPSHPMMVGITSWQQQVPLPQPYTGNNAWRIPLHPVPAQTPLSAKTNFFRGAIALAVNGVPIFNPIKNDGRTDTFLAGELDKWGGHCGRADDYHYHIAPVHLEDVVGAGQPIAYALDGYPIYGYQHPGTTGFAPLDASMATRILRETIITTLPRPIPISTEVSTARLLNKTDKSILNPGANPSALPYHPFAEPRSPVSPKLLQEATVWNIS